MTIEQLRELALKVFHGGIRDIQEDGELMQQFILVQRDGGLIFMVIDGSITNDERAKSTLGRKIRERIAAGDIEAVIHLSDTWLANISPENEQIREKLRMNVVEAAAFGLCEKREAVIGILESPIMYQHMRQFYNRDGRKITLDGEPKIMSNADGTIKPGSGRFSGFFPQSGGGKAI